MTWWKKSLTQCLNRGEEWGIFIAKIRKAFFISERFPLKQNQYHRLFFSESVHRSFFLFLFCVISIFSMKNPLHVHCIQFTFQENIKRDWNCFRKRFSDSFTLVNVSKLNVVPFFSWRHYWKLQRQREWIFCVLCSSFRRIACNNWTPYRWFMQTQ